MEECMMLIEEVGVFCIGIVCGSQVEMERIARQNLEAELQRTLEKLNAATVSCDSLQLRELVAVCVPLLLVL